MKPQSIVLIMDSCFPLSAFIHDVRLPAIRRVLWPGLNFGEPFYSLGYGRLITRENSGNNEEGGEDKAHAYIINERLTW